MQTLDILIGRIVKVAEGPDEYFFFTRDERQGILAQYTN